MDGEFEQLYLDRNNSRLLPPDGLHFIGEAYHFDTETIGQLFLKKLLKTGPMKEQI